MGEPEILADQSALVQMLLYIGGIVIIALVTVIKILWSKINNNENYIRQQDKDNIKMLLEVSNFLKTIGRDVAKIEEAISSPNPRIQEIRELLRDFITKNNERD